MKKTNKISNNTTVSLEAFEKLEYENKQLQNQLDFITKQNESIKKQSENITQQNESIVKQSESTKEQNERIKDENERIKDENERIKDENRIIKSNIDDLKIEVLILNEKVKLLEARLYDRRSEKTDELARKHPNLFDNNYDIFNEAEDIKYTEVEESKDKKVKKPKSKHLNNRKQLPYEADIHYELKDEQLKCECCHHELSEIGTNVVEKVHYRPAKYYVTRHVNHSYKCNHCNSEDTVIISTPINQPFPKSIVDSSVVSNVIVNKYLAHTPLYRQEKLLNNLGIDLSRQNLSNWVLKAAEYLTPLFNKLHNDVLKNDIVHMDETTLNVIKSNKITNYMWFLGSSKYDKPIRLYFYRDNRRHGNAKEILGDFNGYVQSDAYEAYSGENLKGTTNVVCFAHARRYYAEISKLKIPGGNNSQNLSNQAINIVNKLFRIERKLTEKKASLEEISETREKLAKPILIEYREWLDENYDKVLPKSAIGKAMAYSLNHFDALSNYLLDPRLSLDNNLSERAMKNFTLGRKNFLFSFTENGANGSAILYSMIETAIANNLNAFEYLEYVFKKIVTINIKDELELEKLLPTSDLLPDNIRVKRG